MSIVVAAVGDGWPVVDIDLREGRRTAVSFHRLTQSLNRLIQSGGQIAWISPPAIVILSRYDPRESGPARRVEERWRRGRWSSAQSKGLDDREFRRTERFLSNALTGSREFVRCEPALVCLVMGNTKA